MHVLPASTHISIVEALVHVCVCVCVFLSHILFPWTSFPYLYTCMYMCSIPVSLLRCDFLLITHVSCLLCLADHLIVLGWWCCALLIQQLFVC